MAIFGLALIAAGWENATFVGRNPGLSFIGAALVLASRRWPAEDLGLAAAVVFLPFVHWLYMEGFYQGPICSEESGCHESFKFPGAVQTLIEVVPYLVVAWLAWRLAKRQRLTVVPAQHLP